MDLAAVVNGQDRVRYRKEMPTFEAVKSWYLVPFDRTFRCADAPTKPPKAAPAKKKFKESLGELIDEPDDLQRILYADDHYALLLVFQAMNAAGKDGTIRAVMSGLNPAGCQLFSFKKPTPGELDHDFRWRTSQRLLERGRSCWVVTTAYPPINSTVCIQAVSPSTDYA